MSSQSFTIRTPDPLSVVRQRLIAEVEFETPLLKLFPNCCPKSYFGRVEDNRFQIRRTSQRPHKVEPLFEGTFTVSAYGTTIRVFTTSPLGSENVRQTRNELTAILQGQDAPKYPPQFYYGSRSAFAPPKSRDLPSTNSINPNNLP